MRITTAALAAAAILFMAAEANAGGGAVTGGDATAMIAGRQAGMRMSGAIMASMKAAIDAKADVKTQTFAARSLAAWARAVPGMFAEGSNVPSTEALPAVWTDRAGFEAKAAAYADAAAKLGDAAKAGDADAFAAQWTAVRTACGACHDAYKKP